MKTKNDWNKIISDQQTSGLNIATYCRIHKIAPASFYKHRKLFSKSVIFSKITPLLEEAIPKLSFTINENKVEVKNDITQEDLAKILRALLHD